MTVVAVVAPTAYRFVTITFHARTHEVLARTQSSYTETDGQTDTRVASLFVNIATKAHTHTHTDGA